MRKVERGLHRDQVLLFYMEAAAETEGLRVSLLGAAVTTKVRIADDFTFNPLD